MNGRLYIDGIDAYIRYGVFVADSGYDDLVAWAPLKMVSTTDWPDEDGIEADLSAPRLDTREFPIMFCSVAADRTNGLLEQLSAGVYHTFDFRELGIVRKLRLVAQPSREALRNLEKFSLQFADDFPLDGYIYAAPLPVPGIWQRGYEFDGRDLSAYGVWILNDTDNELKKNPTVKKNLLVNLTEQHGVVYDGQDVFFQAKDAALKCFLRTQDKVTFWRNYYALLYTLIQPGERVFYADSMQREYYCFYKNASVQQFLLPPDGGIWCEFSVTLTFTSFDQDAVQLFLGSEDGLHPNQHEGEN